jgi:hypothetical protein
LGAVEDFHFSSFARRFAVAEPRVFAVSEDDKFPTGFNLNGATLFEVQYESGGLGKLFDLIEEVALISASSLQALLESLEDLSATEPLVLYIRGVDRLLADVGPAVLHIATGWEGFAHHANGVSAMFLVLETGPRATVDAAFFPGGAVDWR